MASFDFPDPSQQSTVTNPVTGNTYEWKADPGKWVIVSTGSQGTDDPITNEQLAPIYSAIATLQTSIDDLDFSSAALTQAQQDIIDLKSRVNALELTSFLILE